MIQEKHRLETLFDQKCGGCIVHINIENRFPNEETAWEMQNYAASQGVICFAFTTKISVCENKRAFIGEQKGPICGNPVADTCARVVGFCAPSAAIRKSETQNMTRSEERPVQWRDHEDFYDWYIDDLIDFEEAEEYYDGHVGA